MEPRDIEAFFVVVQSKRCYTTAVLSLNRLPPYTKTSVLRSKEVLTRPTLNGLLASKLQQSNLLPWRHGQERSKQKHRYQSCVR